MIGYKTGLFFVLLIALLLHFYWFNGLSYYQNYEAIQERISLLNSNISLSDTSKIEYKEALEGINEVYDDETNIILALCKWEALLSHDPDSLQVMNFANIEECSIEYCAKLENENKIIRSVIIKLRLCDTYLLPLLYGLLGAIIYSMRNISEEIRTFTFNRFSKTNYATRLFLGSFAGVAIGWFSNSGKINFTDSQYSLTPILLAFVAGYNIEILFSAIDRYIKSQKNSDKKQAPSET